MSSSGGRACTCASDAPPRTDSSSVVQNSPAVPNPHGSIAEHDIDAPLCPLVPDPPRWAGERTGLGGTLDDWRLVSTRVPDAARLSPADLESAVARAYATLAESLAASGHHPVRFWNFVPGIHADMGDGRDRYMVFNAGRFAAFLEWFGSAAVFSRMVPTASAVGIAQGPLVVHSLATRHESRPVENPRQVPAYSYSKRYGPLPPCFARGTLIAPTPGNERLLLVGGTASIVGEDSQHERDARQQALETFENLAHLVAASRGDASPAPRQASFDAFTSLRVYIVRAADAPLLRSMVTERFRNARVEFAQADLCRRELLVEIEGVARV